jgi:hypothetical protein
VNTANLSQVGRRVETLVGRLLDYLMMVNHRDRGRELTRPLFRLRGAGEQSDLIGGRFRRPWSDTRLLFDGLNPGARQ